MYRFITKFVCHLRQKWVTALELAKARAIRIADSDDDDFGADRDINTDKQELQTMLKSLVTKLEDLRTCHDLIIKHGAGLQRSLTELEQIENPTEALAKSKSVNERATLFRITSNAMIISCGEYLTLATTHGRKWQKLLQHEHETRLRLEEMVEQLAKQHSHLEARAIKESKSVNSVKVASTNSDDEDEFFDAEEINTDFFISFPGGAKRMSSVSASNAGRSVSGPVLPSATANDDDSSGSDNSEFYTVNPSSTQTGVISRPRHKRKPSSSHKKSDSVSSTDQFVTIDGDVAVTSGSSPNTPPRTVSASSTSRQDQKERRHGGRIRRKTIPERPNQTLNLWSFMKNCIGKELTKIPMPVNFNEPLSMLQRITEDLEYADLLHKAAKTKDSCEQLTYIAAFCASHYATTSCRTGKPFNPLLGETYECDRTDDLGWRSVAEQVHKMLSHPLSAICVYKF